MSLRTRAAGKKFQPSLTDLYPSVGSKQSPGPRFFLLGPYMDGGRQSADASGSPRGDPYCFWRRQNFVTRSSAMVGVAAPESSDVPHGRSSVPHPNTGLRLANDSMQYTSDAKDTA